MSDEIEEQKTRLEYLESLATKRLQVIDDCQLKMDKKTLELDDLIARAKRANKRAISASKISNHALAIIIICVAYQVYAAFNICS